MQTDPKRYILAACLSAAIACTGLTGCQTEKTADARTQGTQLDDKHAEERIKTALAQDPVYKFTDVNVLVYEGVAQLSGFAETKGQKMAAADIASRQGVRQLINGIVVKAPESASPAGYEYGHPYPAQPAGAAPAKAPVDAGSVQEPNN